MMLPGRLVAPVLILTAWLVGSAFQPAPVSELRGVDGLAHVYDLILDARFADAEAELPHACGPAPREACEVLLPTITWWRIQLDPDSRALDERFSSQVDAAIRATEAWAARDPRNAEACFYTGAAYGLRVQWRVLRGEKLAAARDGKRIKQALDRAIGLDPALDDAYAGLGLYQYYADVAPAAAKVLRFLLMLPGGDRTEGLARVERASLHGRLLQGEAAYQLQILYLWYEHRADLAVELLESLRERYPDNPLFAAQLAQVQDTYLHDLTASLETWRALVTAARDGQVNEPALAEAEGRLGAAHQLEALYQTDRALDEARAVIAARSAQPYGAMATAYLAIGEGEDRLGHRDAAIAAYRQAMTTSPTPDPAGLRVRASEGMQHVPDADRAEGYRLSLEGLRTLERGDTTGAEALLARSLQLDPRDPVARYRYGRVEQSRKHDEAALAAYDIVMTNARACPAPIAAAAYLAAARVHERLAHKDEAIADYRAASTWFGGGAETRAAAIRALTRLRALK